MFIKLTTVASEGIIRLNTDRIEFYTPNENGGTNLILVGVGSDEVMPVKETPKEIDQLIENTLNIKRPVWCKISDEKPEHKQGVTIYRGGKYKAVKYDSGGYWIGGCTDYLFAEEDDLWCCLPELPR